MVRRLGILVAAGLLVAACSSGGAGGGGGSPTDAGGGSTATEAPDAGSGSAPEAGGPEGHRPSGAKVRIVNLYAASADAPGSIDVYASPYALEGDHPLLSIPYGTVSDFFDPTVADDAGDMFLTAYASGVTGNGTEIMSQSETLKGGEVITYVLGTRADADTGARGGVWQSYWDRPPADSQAGTPAPGKGRLVVTSVGLDSILASPDATTWYLGVGNGCAKTPEDDEYTTTTAGVGSSGTWEFDPGSYTAAIHAYGQSDEGIPDCSNAPLFPGVPVAITAGGTVILAIYAPKDGDLRTIVVPLQP